MSCVIPGGDGAGGPVDDGVAAYDLVIVATGVDAVSGALERIECGSGARPISGSPVRCTWRVADGQSSTSSTTTVTSTGSRSVRVRMRVATARRTRAASSWRGSP